MSVFFLSKQNVKRLFLHFTGFPNPPTDVIYIITRTIVLPEVEFNQNAWHLLDF